MVVLSPGWLDYSAIILRERGPEISKAPKGFLGISGEAKTFDLKLLMSDMKCKGMRLLLLPSE